MFTVLTRQSVAPVSEIHDRMPLILGKDDLKEWISKDSDPRKVAKKAVTNLVMEKAKDYPEPKPAFMQLEFEYKRHRNILSSCVFFFTKGGCFAAIIVEPRRSSDKIVAPAAQ